MGAMTGCGPERVAEARGEGYAILARLVAEGVTPCNAELARLSPRLAPLLAAHPLEVLAADHCHVFDLCAPPFEGLIMDPAGRVGSRAGMRARAVLQRAGANVDAGDEPEHLATQLRALAGARGPRAAPLLDHLLCWLVPYEAAVLRTRRAFPIALLGEIVELAVHHRAKLEVRPDVVDTEIVPLDLDHPDTDLWAIAAFLARPAASGVVITRDDLTRIGRDARVPRGFGDRTRMLHGLLGTAAELGLLSPIARALQTIVADHEDRLTTRLGASHRDIIAVWRRRLGFTRTLLFRLDREAGSTTSPTR